MERQILEQALGAGDAEQVRPQRIARAIVLGAEGWHAGVIGIVGVAHRGSDASADDHDRDYERARPGERAVNPGIQFGSRAGGVRGSISRRLADTRWRRG